MREIQQLYFCLIMARNSFLRALLPLCYYITHLPWIVVSNPVCNHLTLFFTLVLPLIFITSGEHVYSESVSSWSGLSQNLNAITLIVSEGL